MTGPFSPLFINISDLVPLLGIIALTIVLLFVVWNWPKS